MKSQRRKERQFVPLMEKVRLSGSHSRMRKVTNLSLYLVPQPVDNQVFGAEVFGADKRKSVTRLLESDSKVVCDWLTTRVVSSSDVSLWKWFGLVGQIVVQTRWQNWQMGFMVPEEAPTYKLFRITINTFEF